MSEDRPGSGMPADGLSEEQVARLLRAAGPVGTTPPDVVTRMDAVLADLVAERAAGSGAAARTSGSEPSAGADPTRTVVSLDAERSRRRTWATRVLVAAAVLGVAGIGLSVADDLTGGSGSESASAGDAAGAQAESSEAGGSSEADGSAGSGGSSAGAGRDDRDAASGADSLEQPGPASELARATKASRLLRITDDADLRAAVRGTAPRGVAGLGSRAGGATLDTRNGVRSGRCVTPDGPGRRTLVSYRGAPATLVVRRSGDRLDGRVYDCDLGLQLDGVEIGPAGE